MATTTPGTLFQRTFTLRFTLPIALTLAVGILTYLHATHDTWRETIEFLGVAAGVAGGLLSAYYIGRTLKDSIAQRDQDLLNKRLEVAFDFCRRWYTHELRHEWAKIRRVLRGKSGQEILQALTASDAERRTAGSIVSFFEEVGYAVRVGRAEAIHLKELMGTAIERTYATLEPWIDEFRRVNNQSTFAEHFQWLKTELRRNIANGFLRAVARGLRHRGKCEYQYPPYCWLARESIPHQSDAGPALNGSAYDRHRSLGTRDRTGRGFALVALLEVRLRDQSWPGLSSGRMRLRSARSFGHA